MPVQSVIVGIQSDIVPGTGSGRQAVALKQGGRERCKMTARIRVGTASWTDHEPFYPPEYNRSERKAYRISYYARFFSLVEVDSTFYSLQPARNFAMWADRTPDDFVFNVKAYGELTWHHRDDAKEVITPAAETFARFSEMLEPSAQGWQARRVAFPVSTVVHVWARANGVFGHGARNAA